MSAVELLKTYFGYDSFRPLQAEVIEHILAGNDALVLMPTGGGKSLCYQLPALAFPGLTLVVSPLIALMKDQVDGLRANGVPAGFINSSLPASDIADLQLGVESGKVKLLYVAPERLAAAGFREWLNCQKLSLIAIDEAHCISEWGHDFRPDYRNLAMLRQDFKMVPVVALTATATPRVRDDIASQLGLEEGRLFQSSFDRQNLTYLVEPKRPGSDRLKELLKVRPDQSAIVYCFSRRDTEKLAEDLNRSGFSALAYHAGLSAADRSAAQDRFIRDEVNVMVATVAFGMGIDKPDIRLVVHYDLPKTIEGYYQEMGRAGRDGLASDCVLFYAYGDSLKHSFFINQLASEAERQNAKRKLSEVVSYCEAASCRRRLLLKYFGEASGSSGEILCGSCDVCLSPAEKFDATEICQKILSAVLRTGERFGAGYVVEILQGSKTAKILEREHDKLSVFGIGRDFAPAEIKQLIRLIIGRGLLRQSGEYPILELTREGKAFLADKQTIELPRLAPKPVRKLKTLASSLDYNRELFDQLRDERRRLAIEQGVPPFVVCGDRTLIELAHYLPQTKTSMAGIFGLGDQKVAKYGEVFIKLISRFATKEGMQEKPKLVRSEPVVLNKSLAAGATHYETAELLKSGLSVDQIAQARALGVTTIIGHIEVLLAAGEAVDLVRLKPIDLDLSEVEQAGKTAGGWELLAPVKAIVGEKYSYNDLRLARLLLSVRFKENTTT